MQLTKEEVLSLIVLVNDKIERISNLRLLTSPDNARKLKAITIKRYQELKTKLKAEVK